MRGLEGTYCNTTLEFGTKDVLPIVLGIKNSGADGLYLPLDNDTNVAIVQALQQNGVKMKANVLATGYSQQLLDQPVAKLMTPNDVLFSAYKPVELTKDPAVKKFRANLKKYAGITGVPDYGATPGTSRATWRSRDSTSRREPNPAGVRRRDPQARRSTTPPD